MNHRKKYTAPLILVISIMLLAGCSWFSSSEPTPPGPPAPDYPEDPADFIFYYDFADIEPGDVPSGEEWSINNADGERGDIEVVVDPEIDSERALHVVTHKVPKVGVSMHFPGWELPSDDEVIAFEYKVKYVEGTAGMYLYVNNSNHKIILLPGSGQLVWHASNDGLSPTTIALLEPGWNTIRVVANRATRLGDVYINNMDSPVASSLMFQRAVDTWDGTKFILTHESNEDDVREAYYADFKVWAVDPEEGN